MQTPEQKRARKAKYMRHWRKNNPDAIRAIERKARGIVNAPTERRAGPCCICSHVVDPLYCDHDHKTGRFRGWLCKKCNFGLGQFQDSPSLLQRAQEYLARS